MARLNTFVEGLKVYVLLVLEVLVELCDVRVIHELHDADHRPQTVLVVHLRLADKLHHADVLKDVRLHEARGEVTLEYL